MDSAPVFAAMLDPRDGGCFTLEPAVPYRVSRRYLPRTNVLETTARVRVVAVDRAGAHLDEQRVDGLEQAE